MRREEIRKAYDEVLPDVEERARMLQSILLAASDARPERTEIKVLKKKGIKRGAVIILAAALALALSVTVLAYTTDLFGFRALAKPNTENENDFMPDDGETLVSLTQPQDIPEDVYTDVGGEIAKEIAEKLENNRLAWEEWQNSGPNAYYRELSELEEKYDLNGWDCTAVAKHEDGSASVDYYSFEADAPGSDSGTYIFEGTVEMPVEDYKRYTELLDILELFEDTGEQESKYDFNYQVNSKAQEAKLEEIAAKYGLSLRGNLTMMWEESPEEISDRISELMCSGKLFNETPAGFDKAYYFDEGSFCVSWYANVPSGGEKVDCYGYNSVYSTLSSGNEVMESVADINSFNSRVHECPDGTSVTILSDGSEAFIYVYLENSFFAEHVRRAGAALTDADIDYIADNINYSVIGK